MRETEAQASNKPTGAKSLQIVQVAGTAEILLV